MYEGVMDHREQQLNFSSEFHTLFLGFFVYVFTPAKEPLSVLHIFQRESLNKRNTESFYNNSMDYIKYFRISPVLFLSELLLLSPIHADITLHGSLLCK